MKMTGRDLERLLKSVPVAQQQISHYEGAQAPVVLTMLLADGSRVALVSYDVQYEPGPATVPPAPIQKPVPTQKAPPGATQRLGFDGHGINNFRAMGER